MRASLPTIVAGSRVTGEVGLWLAWVRATQNKEQDVTKAALRLCVAALTLPSARRALGRAIIDDRAGRARRALVARSRSQRKAEPTQEALPQCPIDDGDHGKGNGRTAAQPISKAIVGIRGEVREDVTNEREVAHAQMFADERSGSVTVARPKTRLLRASDGRTYVLLLADSRRQP